MSAGEVVASAWLAFAVLATGRVQRSWLYAAVGVSIVAATAYLTLRDGIKPVVISGPIGGSFVLAETLLGLLFWIDLVGLPPSIAGVTGIGLRRPHDRETSRRSAVAWLGVVGVSSLAVGLAQTNAYLRDGIDPLDPGAWLALLELAIGAGFVLGASLILVRR